MPGVSRTEPSSLPETVRFGCCVLDTSRGVVVAPDGTETMLRPKTLELLRLLLRHPGRVVTRGEILDAVWPGLFVTDDSITQCVVELRRAMGPAGASLLRTVPRRGYLLERGAEPQVSAPATPARSAGVPVLAVLPFRPLPPDRDGAILAEAMTDGVIGAIATLRELAVISGSSTRHMRDVDLLEAGARLGTDYVATGTLQRQASRIRLSAELADARSGAVLLFRSFSGDAEEDQFEMQDRIASVIANALTPRVSELELTRSRRERPADLAAYYLLIEARRLMLNLDRGSLDEAGRLLRRALDLDPEHAATHATLANWHSLRLGQGLAEDRPGEAAALEAAAQAALARDANHARALALLGHSRTVLHLRHEEALSMFERALNAAPNDAETWMWTSPTFAWMGAGVEAVNRAQRAIALSPEDPLMFRYTHFLSIAQYASGDYEAAAQAGESSRRANPHYVSNLRMTAAALVAAGREQQARGIAREAMALEPAFRVSALMKRLPLRGAEARETYRRRLLAAGFPG
jgi:TolB-like protein